MIRWLLPLLLLLPLPAFGQAQTPAGYIPFRIMPNCPDTGGNHLNWNRATGHPSCGTSGGGGGASLTIGTTSIAGGTANALLFDTGTLLGAISSANSSLLVTNVSGVPSFSTALPNGLAMGQPISLDLTHATGLPNAGLVNAATTVNGVVCTLGSTCAITATAGTITPGTTTIAGGTPGDIEYNNGGVLGEKAVSGSGSVVLATSPSIAGLTVTSGFTATGLVTNADLANAATTVNGVSCVLGATCSVTATAASMTVGTTTVLSGTPGNFLFDSGGLLGELGSVGTGNLLRAASPVMSAATVTGSFTATGLVTNADLVNAATTVNGTTCTLGSTCSVTATAGSVTVGTTTVSGGTTGRIEFNNSGVLGELPTTGTAGNVVLSISPTLTTPNLGTPASVNLANASNLPTSALSGVVAVANGGAGTINGALKANGSGVVSQAACADLSNAGTACTANTGTSGAALPLLNGNNAWSAGQAVTPVALTFGATVNTNAALSNHFTFTATSNFTLANPSNLKAGQTMNWWITQDFTGSRTLTTGTFFQAAGGSSTLVLGTAANSKSLLTCQADTASTMTCSVLTGIVH